MAGEARQELPRNTCCRAKLSPRGLFSGVSPVRFGYGLGWNGSSGSGFRFLRCLWEGGLYVFQHAVTERDSSGFGS